MEDDNIDMGYLVTQGPPYRGFGSGPHVIALGEIYLKTQLQRRTLKLKAQFESVSSYFSSKR